MAIVAQTKEENRAEWFWMLMSYVKFKTLEFWLCYYPDMSYESFEAIWPQLLDQRLSSATRTTVKLLSEKLEHSSN